MKLSSTRGDAMFVRGLQENDEKSWGTLTSE